MRHAYSRFLLPRFMIPVVALAALVVFGEPLPRAETARFADTEQAEAPSETRTVAAPANDPLQMLERNVRELKAMRIRLVLTLPAVGH